VTHIVLRKGELLDKDRVLPIERIERIDLDGLHLNGTAEELNQYPAYDEEVFVEPLEGWEALESYATADTLFWGGPFAGIAPPVLPVIEFVMPIGVPENDVVLRRGADVIYKEELVGSLDHMLFDRRSGTVTYLVVDAYESGRRIFVPAEWIGELVGEAVTLKHWDPDQPGVSIYEPARDDAAILSDLKAKLRELELGAVQVHVDRAVVRLSGHVPTADDKTTAESIARSIPGVLEVENALAADSELLGAILYELASEEQIAGVPIAVRVENGVVRLKGVVPEPEIKSAVEAIVQRVPGVVAVLNELEVTHHQIYH
jgi:osmotically-inducible protein OsmY